MSKFKLPLIIYVVCLGVYLGTASGRLKGPSKDNHYVYLAQNLLDGRLSLEGRPPHQNDWALVEEIELADGRRLRGQYMRTGGGGRFKTTAGQKIDLSTAQIKNRKQVYYVSFPWFPAILMIPFVAIWGLKFNDVIFTAAVAALNPVLIYWMLRRLAFLGYSARKLVDDLWLVAMFAFGTVHFFSSVLGQVWYTAHVVGVSLTILYVIAALEGKHPLLAGLCLGVGFVTRTPIPFSFPLIVGEILRRHLQHAKLPSQETPSSAEITWRESVRAFWMQLDKKPAFRDLSVLSLPVVGVAAVAMVLNARRFDNPLEFGHKFLNVKWLERIQRWGLFNYHFVARNLTAMFTLLPRILAKYPYIKVSWHGMSLFLTTPMFAYLIWPRGKKTPLRPLLYLSCLFPMLLHLFYQNSGWTQFGFRFSLDYTAYLVALWAISNYRIGWFARALIIWGIGVNAFGAITYGRMWQFYWDGHLSHPVAGNETCCLCPGFADGPSRLGLNLVGLS